MDSEQRTRLDPRPDTVEPSIPVRFDPVERRRRIVKAQDLARRTQNDPREAAIRDELGALQADSPIP